MVDHMSLTSRAERMVAQTEEVGLSDSLRTLLETLHGVDVLLQPSPCRRFKNNVRTLLASSEAAKVRGQDCLAYSESRPSRTEAC
jgi:hypothetical protein